jgi:hypothetical protein
MGYTDSGMIFDHYRELVKPTEAERFWNVRPASTEKILPIETRGRPSTK